MIFGISASKIWLSIGQTVYMVGISLLSGLLIAFPLAIILFLTRKGGIKQNQIVYNIISAIINIIRSVPFIILIVYIMPFTKAIVGTRVGSTAALVPLTAYIAPYLARLIENALFETDKGIIEASQAMGATIFQTIFKFVLPEAKGSIILGITTEPSGWTRSIPVICWRSWIRRTFWDTYITAENCSIPKEHRHRYI